MVKNKNIIDRINKLLEYTEITSPVNYAEVYSSTLSLLILLYGENSARVKDLSTNQAFFIQKYTYLRDAHIEMKGYCRGILLNIKSEIENGLILSLEKQFTGEVYGDFIALSKQVIGQNNKAAAAVLASAALEDSLKRYANLNNLDVGDKTMNEVINILKGRGLLKGPQASIATSYVFLRNKAFHAQFEEINTTDVRSLIGFTEEFILQNFQ